MIHVIHLNKEVNLIDLIDMKKKKIEWIENPKGGLNEFVS